jgi:hypothetical protein
MGNGQDQISFSTHGVSNTENRGQNAKAVNLMTSKDVRSEWKIPRKSWREIRVVVDQAYEFQWL